MAYTTAEAKSKLDTVINKVAAGKGRVALTRRGKPVAAVVPFEDLEYLERIEAEEEAEDIRLAKAAMKDYKKHGGIPWEDVKKELGYK